jgi:hypothetical protein
VKWQPRAVMNHTPNTLRNERMQPMTQPYQPQPPQPEPTRETPLQWIKRVVGFKLSILIAILGLASCGAFFNAIGGEDPATTAQPTPSATVTVTATAAATSKAAKEPSPKATKTTKPKPKKQEPKTEPAARVSKRQWAKIVKKPESYKGDKYIIYGQVTQFDSATGDDNFLADTAHRNTMSYGFFDGENTLLTGTAKQLDDLVEDDVFRASVTVLGKMDYDTQIGGNTTVPLLEVNSIKVVG